MPDPKFNYIEAAEDPTAVSRVGQQSVGPNSVRSHQASTNWTKYPVVWSTVVGDSGVAAGSLVQPVIGDGTLKGRFKVYGNSVTVQVTVIYGAGTNLGAGAYRFSLPYPATADSATYIGALRSYGDNGVESDRHWLGFCLVESGDTVIIPYSDNSNSPIQLRHNGPLNPSDKTNNRHDFQIEYEADIARPSQ